MSFTTGIYDISAAEYHSDPCPAPSLSSGIAWEFIERTPWHAWTAHPKLNPNYAPDDDKKFDVGTVAHTLVLGKGDEIATIDAADYKSKAAREEREEAIAAGKSPILSEQFDRAATMAEAIRAQLQHHEIGDVFERHDGQAEQAVLWLEDTAWCRCLPDWMIIHGLEPRVDIYDLKTTTNAHPNVWRNRVEQIGFAFKAAFYIRGIRAVTGCDNIRYRWIAVEVDPPHALAVYEPDETDLYGGEDPNTGYEILGAEEMVESVLGQWRECLATGIWPGYPPKVMTLPLSTRYRSRQSARRDTGELSSEAIRQAIEWTKEVLAT